MKTNRLLITLMLLGALFLAGCDSRARVGALRNESRSVELGEARSIRVDIDFGAGDLKITGGAEKLLEADFTYNVSKLKPEVKYTDNTLVVQQPDTKGLPFLADLTDFRNEWDLNLNDEVPMDLHVGVGGGTSNLDLAGLSLSGLNITMGAGDGTIDLSGVWKYDLDATIDIGAAHTTVRLPRDVGARVEVEAGPTIVEAPDMAKDGGVYTNSAYGVSDVTLLVRIEAGIGILTLEVAE